jgi:glutathione S-transferase
MSIILYQFPKPNRPSFSPFCAKIEIFLKAHKIPYENKFVMNPQKAPYGKLPYIKDGTVGIPDSDEILKYLIEKYKINSENHLNAEEKAINHLIEVSCNENLYWVMIQDRWINLEGLKKTTDLYFSQVPTLFRSYIAKMVHRNMKKQMHGHGIGRHPESIIQAKGIEDLKAISAILGDKHYLGGQVFTKADATLFSFLYNFIYTDYHSDSISFAKSQDNLKRYVDRIYNQFWN